MRYCCIATPLGPMTIVAEQQCITHLYLGQVSIPEADASPDVLLAEASAQLLAYLQGGLRTFSLPLNPQGTAFQRSCWAALLQIPYGETRTYGQQAALVGKPQAARAVGMANHRNPLPIFVPCHRIVSADGKLTGYAGGLWLKQQLLQLERQHAPDCSKQTDSQQP